MDSHFSGPGKSDQLAIPVHAFLVHRVKTEVMQIALIGLTAQDSSLNTIADANGVFRTSTIF